MKLKDLPQSNQDFINELRTQMSPEVLMFFDLILSKLEKPDPADQERLSFLDCLLANGVDNWEGYEACLPDTAHICC